MINKSPLLVFSLSSGNEEPENILSIFERIFENPLTDHSGSKDDKKER